MKQTLKKHMKARLTNDLKREYDHKYGDLKRINEELATRCQNYAEMYRDALQKCGNYQVEIEKLRIQVEALKLQLGPQKYSTSDFLLETSNPHPY